MAAIDTIDTLTTREQEILKQLSKGLHNREIADQLSLSVRSIEKYRSSLCSKLNTSELAQLSEIARYCGLTD